jgi:hypothetical protein
MLTTTLPPPPRWVLRSPPSGASETLDLKPQILDLAFQTLHPRL